MTRYEKAAHNRETAASLNAKWGVGAVQCHYRETGNWYHKLSRFPAALFDAHGYILFPTEEAYRALPGIQTGKEIGVPRGISALPGYMPFPDLGASPTCDLDIHSDAATEGHRRLVLHLERERNQNVVREKKKHAASFNCEVCNFSFGAAYGSAARDYCKVHHLLPLSDVKHSTRTRLKDLAILCANCHRVVHLQNPPYTLGQVKSMLEGGPLDG